MNLKKQKPDTADRMATVLFGNFIWMNVSIIEAISNADSGSYRKFVIMKFITACVMFIRFSVLYFTISRIIWLITFFGSPGIRGSSSLILRGSISMSLYACLKYPYLWNLHRSSLLIISCGKSGDRF